MGACLFVCLFCISVTLYTLLPPSRIEAQRWQRNGLNGTSLNIDILKLVKSLYPKTHNWIVNNIIILLVTDRTATTRSVSLMQAAMWTISNSQMAPETAQWPQQKCTRMSVKTAAGPKGKMRHKCIVLGWIHNVLKSKKLNNPARLSPERCLIKCLANRIYNKLKLWAKEVCQRRYR